MGNEQWQEPNDNWQEPGDDWALPHSSLPPRLSPQVEHQRDDGPALFCLACGMLSMMAVHTIFKAFLSPSSFGPLTGVLWLLCPVGAFAGWTVLSWIVAIRR